MKFFKLRLLFTVLSLLTLLLSACSNAGRTDITQTLKEGVVKITYENETGHATGFFIKGAGEDCTVLTVAHAVPEGRDIRVTAYDSELYEVTRIQRAADDDLAAMTFAVEGEAVCPYSALALGKSAQLKIDDFVRMAGFPERSGAVRLVMQYPSGKVTKIEIPPLPDGYAISYDMTSVGGMSGSPVVNAKGKVIGIHGLTDSEIVIVGHSQQSSLSETQADEIEAAEERVRTRINHFKWGIPIQRFIEQRTELLNNIEKSSAAADVSPENAVGIAEATITAWLDAKRAAYGEDKDTGKLENVLTGQTLESSLTDVEASKAENWYIDYDHATVEILSVEPEDATTAESLTATATIVESRTVYDNGAKSERFSYTDESVTVSYELVREGNRWLIESAKVEAE